MSSHSGYIDGEQKEIFSSNKPLAGDILLLEGIGLRSKASRAFGRGKFSHVGMGIGADLYIDAVSGDGVRVRRIADINTPSSGYALDRCVVARNWEVFESGKAHGMIGPLTYYDRAYALFSIWMPDRSTKSENDPVICSKLVALLMRDQDLDLGREPRRTFPKHIDEFCNGDKWERFLLRQYDLIDDPNSISDLRAKFTEQSLETAKNIASLNKIIREGIRKSEKNIQAMSNAMPYFEKKIDNLWKSRRKKK